MARFVGLIFLVASLSLAGCGLRSHSNIKQDAQQRWSRVRADIKLQLARQAYENKQFEETIRAASESIALHPSRADAYRLLAQANLELGRDASARRTLQAAARAGLRSPGLIYTASVLDEKRGGLETALAGYAKAQRLDPTQPDYLIAQAECLVELGQPQTALGLLDENAGNLDDPAMVSILSAQIADLMHDSERAVRHYRAARVTMGEADFLDEELGLLLTGLGRYEEAAPLLEPLVQSPARSQENGAARRALATAHLAQRRPVDAAEVLEDYTHAHPADLRAQLLLAQAALEAGDELTALRAIDTAGHHGALHPDVQLMQALIQWRRLDFGGAASTLFDLLSVHPNDVDAHCLLGEVLSARARVAAARKHFQRAVELDPQCAWALTALASLPEDEQSPMQTATKLTAAAGPS